MFLKSLLTDLVRLEAHANGLALHAQKPLTGYCELCAALEARLNPETLR